MTRPRREIRVGDNTVEEINRALIDILRAIDEQAGVGVEATVDSSQNITGDLTVSGDVSAETITLAGANLATTLAAKAANPHSNTAHSETYITSAAVTYANLNATSGVGTGANQVLPSTVLSGVGKITVATSAPGSPSANDLWVDIS